MQNRQARIIDTLFFILLALVPVIAIPWQEGIEFCDSASYVYHAKQFLTTYSIDYWNLFSTRVMAWLPYSVYIYFFGVNDSITWVATLEFCILLCAIYYSLRNYDQVVALYSVILLGFSTLMIRESTVAMGDMMLTLMVNLPVLIYWRFIKNEAYPKTSTWGLVAGICWVLAFYTKEVAAYYLALCLWFTIIAYRQKLQADLRFWQFFWSVVIIAGLASAGYFYFQTGDAFQKLRRANENIIYTADSLGQAWRTWDELAYRLTFQPVFFLVYEYTIGLLMLLAVFYHVQNGKSRNEFWRWYLIVPLAIWWIFPLNLNPYYPMWLIHRLWLPLMVPLAISAGHGMKIFVIRSESRLARIILAAAGISLIIISYVFFGYEDLRNQKRVLYYSVVALFLIIALFERSQDKISNGRKVITFIALFLAIFLHESNMFPGWKLMTLFAILVAILIHESNRLLPGLRYLALFIVLLPYFYDHINRIHWNKDSEYNQVKALVEVIKKKDDSPVVLAPSCFVEFTKLYDDKDLLLIAYENVERYDTLHDVFLIIDKNLIGLKYAPRTNASAFLAIENIRYHVETQPAELGFKLMEENKRYQIYYKQ